LLHPQKDPMKTLNHELKNLLLTTSVLLLFTPAVAQQEAYESPAGTKFLLYTPPGYYSSTSTFPLLLSLHSKGEVGDDLTELTSKNPEQMPSRLIYLNKWPQDLPFIVLTPQLTVEDGDPDPVWGPQWPPDYIDEVVRYVTSNFMVDLQRIYVTGISKGAIGTWNYAAAYPDKVAAVIPLSGRSDLTKACALKDIPVWAFHGDGDETVSPQYSIDMVNAIRACAPSGKYKPELTILNAKGHNGWNEVYNGTNEYKIYEWLLKFKKNDSANKPPYVNAGRDLRIQLRNAPLHLVGDFFDSEGSISNVVWRQTSGTALTLDNTGSEFLRISELKTGSFEFELSVTDDKGAKSTDRVTLEITDSLIKPAITQLILINGKTDTEIGPLSEGQVIDKAALNLAEINIKAIATEETASVKFSINTDQNTRTQNAGPYFIKGQTTYPEWKINNGTYLICATPYSQTYTRGTAGISQCYKVTVTDGLISEGCSATGKIQAEVWTGITGTDISSIPTNSTPSSILDLTMFETPSNLGDNYGSRVRGYLCVPTSGDYTFWIASDDRSELWLSTDDNPANKAKIAYVTGWTSSRQWDKYTSQKSAAVSLVAGNRYYIEALLKEASGGDHLAVGWQLPGGTLERPIPGLRLIIFENPSNSFPSLNITSPEDGQSFTSPASISITATASDSDGSISKVEFYNGQTKLGEDSSSPYSFAWNDVPAGNYSLVAKAIDNSSNSATDVVNITVTSGSNGVSCSSTGKIQAEVWTGITGTDVSSIPVNSPPSSVLDLTTLETPANIGDNYGSRVRGYLCVPTSGNYTFWIASDDRSELWLSTDENPANKVRIAYVSGWTYSRQWDKYSTQVSASIPLVAREKYYIEALHKEASGGDNVAVGWQLPDGTLERPIPGTRLSPFVNGAPSVHITNPTSNETFTALASISITANASDTDGTVAKVEFFEGLNKLGEDLSSPYSYSWSNVAAGTYSLTARAIDNEGKEASSSAVNISVIANAVCTASGQITREEWSNVPGYNVSDIPVNDLPTYTEQLTIFEGPTNIADNYGARIRGYICPPTSGNYTFWIASDDESDLWLSTDDNPANKVKIAYVPGWTYSREWDKYSTQISASISLVAGQRYYIEALHKEASGADNVAVGWALPDGTLERPIPGTRLSPFSGGQMSWDSYDIVIGPESTEQGVIYSDLSSPAVVEFYQSTDDFGVTKGSLFSGYDPGNHPNAASHATNYWWVGSGSRYPYAGLSTVARGFDTGEGNIPQPLGVMDLQLHPPNSNKLAVAAFIVPKAGNYNVSNLAARRVSERPSTGGTIRFQVFDQNKIKRADILATNNQDWATDANTIVLENLAANDRIYFATSSDGEYDYDFTEVSWTVTLVPTTSTNSAARTSSTSQTELVTEISPEESPEVISALYPNPVQNIMHVTGLLGSEAVTSIYNGFGMLVYQEKVLVMDGGVTLNVGHYRSGMYYVVVRSDREIQRHKFLKE
jgi:hypothetical protein